MEESSSVNTSPNINSVLKPPKPRIPLRDIMAAVHDEDNTADRKRRVSFANVNKVKEFSAVAESMVICHTPAYEEPFYLSSDSSYPSGADGLTPAKNISMAADSIQAFIHSEQKEQYPPILNRGSFSGNFVETIENLPFQSLQTLSFPKPRVSGLLTQDNNTVFATSSNSFDAMDLTKCIDNRQSMARNSTRFSMGMDLTECIDNGQHTTRSSRKFSIGIMDLTECINNIQNATSNVTRFSMGMDMTNIVGKSLNTSMSLSSEGMDLTKGVISNDPYSDNRPHQFGSCANFSDGVDLDDSNALELTDAINDPRLSAMSMLYSVSNTGLNKNGQPSVPDKTRYSLSGMDLTKAAISNCSSARRKSTRYSVSNMDLTEVVRAGDSSGVDFTEVINDPIIVAMSSRYSVNEMELTEGLGDKDHTQFSTDSIESIEDVEGKLDYSAASETSMDFTKPIHNILQSHEQTDTLNGYSMERNAITGEGRKSSCLQMKSQDIDVNEELNESLSKTYKMPTIKHTLHSLRNDKNSILIQDDKENLLSGSVVLHSQCNNTNFQNTPASKTQFNNENPCTAVTFQQFSPEIKHGEEVVNESMMDLSEIGDKPLSLVHINNSLTSSSKAETVDVCLEESLQPENKVELNEISTSFGKLQDCKTLFSQTNIKTNDHSEQAEVSCENMDISGVDSSLTTQSNYTSRSGTNNPFVDGVDPKSAEEASKSKLSSLKDQQLNSPAFENEKMEVSELADNNNFDGIPDSSLLAKSQPHEADCAPIGKEDYLNTATDRESIKPISLAEEHSKLNISASSTKNKQELKGNNCMGNHVKRESLHITESIGNSIIKEVANNVYCGLSSELSTSELNMDEENIDDSLNVSENNRIVNKSVAEIDMDEENIEDGLKAFDNNRMANISLDDSLMLKVKPIDPKTLFISYSEGNENHESLQQSHNEGTEAVEPNLSFENLADISTNNTLCAKNITMTRGSATIHNTVFSISDSLSEMNHNENSLVDHNMEHTSVLESLPLIQCVAMSGEVTRNSSEVQQEGEKSSDVYKTKTQKGGKRSFEEALKPEDDTKESPLKQLCLSKGDCDLLINETAPSFLMDTISVPNEASQQVSDVTLKTSRILSPTKNKSIVNETAPSFLMDTISAPNDTSHQVSDVTLKTSRLSPTKNQSTVELTVNRKGFLENVELNNTTMSFVQKRNLDDICENSFSLRVDISTDHDSSKVVVRKDEKRNINVEINEHMQSIPELSKFPESRNYPTVSKTVGNRNVSSSQCKTVQQSCSPPESPLVFEPTYSKIRSKSKSVGYNLYNKKKEPTSGASNEEHLGLRHSLALPKLTSLNQQKEMEIFSKHKKIINLGGGLFVCDLIPKWIEFHFVADLGGNILNPRYKIICLERERAVGEYVLQQVKACPMPQNASDLMTQLNGTVYERLAELARSVSLICKYHNGKLKGNILTVELMNSKKHYWIFVDINIKYPQNIGMPDITLSQQKLGEFKLAHLRQIFDSIDKSPKQLLQFASELTKLQWH